MRRVDNVGLIGGSNVSIHAPVKVRPPWWGLLRRPQDVSIHAPVKVRRQSDCVKYPTRSFNPRTREGATAFIDTAGADLRFNPRTREGATCPPVRPVRRPAVSIHAPVKVRRDNFIVFERSVAVSIHAPVKVRRTSNQRRDQSTWFQSTHP